MKKKAWVGLALLTLGVVLILLPLHIAMTGLTVCGYGFLCLADWFAGKHGWHRGWHTAVIAVGIAVAVILTAATAAVLILGRSQWEEARKADYVVVLGAQVHGNEPSRTLRARLDLALELMKENPDAVFIVAGGQGKDERNAEASVMYDYMARRGAELSRLYPEDQSHTTRENLKNAAAIVRSLGMDSSRPAIITSEFHLCRAKYIASTLGMDACGAASRTEPLPLMLNYALREVFAFVKAWMLRQT